MLKDLVIELSTLLGASAIILTAVKKHFFNPIIERIDEEKMERVKVYLVGFISDLECGEPKNEIHKMIARELYDYYISHNGNSYVHDHWENLKSEGKI